MPLKIKDIEFYDLEETSERMNLTVKVLRRWIREGKLKAQKVGVKYYVTEDQMLDVFKPAKSKNKERCP